MRLTECLFKASLLAAGTGLSLAFGVVVQSPAQQTGTLPAELLANLARLRDAALASDYAWQQVAHLSENIGPRLAGSLQAEAAVNYVANELRRLGLEVKLEDVTVPHWVRGEEKAELTKYPGQAAGTVQKIVLTALGNSAATPADGLTADVVVVSDFDELTALGHDKVAGRIVLFNEKFDKRMAAAGRAGAAYSQAVAYRGRGPRAAATLGAVAALVRSVGSADYRLPHTGASGRAGIPAAAVAAEDADLLAHLTQQGRVVMHLVLTPQTLPDVVSHNVIADLKGSEHPEQIVIVSGHLDSWDLATGATDDAAGVAVAMAAAELCKRLGLTPRRTLRVVAWMNEENGGSGNKRYMAEYESSLSNHIAAIESDLGAGHPLGFAGMFSASARAPLRQIAKVLSPIGATLVEESGHAPADVSPMGRRGVPAFGLMQDERTYFNYHHTAADTLDKIDPQELAENAAVMVVLGFALADMPEALPRVTGSE
ncbi:MAG TPA: M20/M25/M40 family metallo-hydrolase [Xanthobacteraceae bacterium]|jgi:Zn-dependent M28 family amino/carboxypeptidase